jgi:hypothetical protein
MTTAQQLIDRVRVRLDETTPAFWTDAQLLGFLNEGLRDAGRVTRHIQDRVTLNWLGNTPEAVLPESIIEVELVYWLPGDGRQIELTGQSFDTMSQVWGQFQNQRVGEPVTYSLYGVPPQLRMKVYPTPQLAGQVSMFVRRMPAQCAALGDTVEWPPAWEDLIEDWVEMAALRRARDPRWQEAFAMYREKRDELDTNGSYDANPDHFVYDGIHGVLPRWLIGE